MDKTLLGLFVLSLILVVVWATHAVLMLALIIGLAYMVVWGAWSLLQGLNQTSHPQRVFDEVA